MSKICLVKIIWYIDTATTLWFRKDLTTDCNPLLLNPSLYPYQPFPWANDNCRNTANVISITVYLSIASFRLWQSTFIARVSLPDCLFGGR